MWYPNQERCVYGVARRCLAALAVLLLFPLSIRASEVDAEDEADSAPAAEATYLETVTVTATRSEQTLADTPGHVDVVDRQEIEDLGYTNIADLVRFAPGVYVANDVTRLGTSGFNIRGIGGNRILTQVDGVPVAEQFDFGPFSVTQFSLDLDTLESVEVVRSAGSALYGSDALGGVVALETRSPSSYLGSRSQIVGLRTGYDGRRDELSESLVYARGGARLKGSIVYTHRDGAEQDNQGNIRTEDGSRTAPNPIDRRHDNVLGKLTYNTDSGTQTEATVEWFDARTDTEVLSSRNGGSPFGSAVLDFDARDDQERMRLSLEQSLVRSSALADSILWRVYWQDADTDQVADELRLPSLGLAQRNGLVAFEQETTGAELEVRKAFDKNGDKTLTYGLLYRLDDFDQFRDRTEAVIDTGQPVPTSLIFPTKYFPQSETEELGLFAQAELLFAKGRVRLIPGIRFDSYDLDSDADDQIFLDGNPGQATPADISEDSVSPKLGIVVAANDQISFFGQYARGFRAPPMSSVNNGFTNRAGGYRTLSNRELEPETSDNFEVGIRGAFRRGSFSLTVFQNDYQDFIETVFLGFNPAEGLVEFQPQNVTDVSIGGIEFAGDVRFGRNWRLRGALSIVDGDNETSGEPLESIQPSTLVTGLRYQSTAGRWGVEGVTTFVDSKSASDLPSNSNQFQTPGYELVDIAAWWTVREWLTLQLSGWNLTDETYWEWTNARGRSGGDVDLDRFTSPGRSVGLQARFNF